MTHLTYLAPLAAETSKAFAAFTIYRDLGPGRSIDAGYNKATSKVGRANKVWADWSTKYQWVERAKLYDTYIAEQRRKRLEVEHTAELEEYRKELARSSRASLQAGQRMLKMAIEKLQAMEKNKEQPPSKSLPAFVKAANDTITSAMDGWGMALTVDELMGLLDEVDSDDT
jgi:hypothetical protein